MGGWGGFLVITVSHPTFCCVGFGVVVEIGVGCDNIVDVKEFELHHFVQLLPTMILYVGSD